MKLATTFAGLTLAIAAAYSAPAVSQTIHGAPSAPTARCQAALPNFRVGYPQASACHAEQQRDGRRLGHLRIPGLA